MNPSIYDYQLPGEEHGKELNLTFISPYKIIRPLSIHGNTLSLLVDIDVANETVETNIVRLRSFQDFQNYCDNPAQVAFGYTYLGYFDDFHYFIFVNELKNLSKTFSDIFA